MTKVLKVPGHSKYRFHKIPRPVLSQIHYITDSVPGTQRSRNKDDVGRRNGACHYGFGCRLLFCHLPSLKRSRLGVAIAGKDGTMPGEIDFVISRFADRDELSIM